MSRLFRRLVLCLLVLPVVALGAAAPTAESAQSPTTFSGRATALSGTVAGIDIPCIASANNPGLTPQNPQPPDCAGVADTGPIAVGSTDANLEASLLCYPAGPNCTIGVPILPVVGSSLAAEALHAAVVARGNTSRAEASVANFSLAAAGQTIGATILDARAQATCTGTGAVVKAGA